MNKVSNLTKRQKATLAKLNRGWKTEEELKALGVSRLDVAALQTKGVMQVQVVDGQKVFAIS